MIQKIGQVLYAANADIYYATGMEMHDPYLWYRDGKGKTHVVMSALEIDRAKRVAKVDHVHDMHVLIKDILARGEAPSVAQQVKWLVEKYPAAELEVPFDFASGLLDDLRELGLKVAVKKAPFFPTRAIKKTHELEAMRKIQTINAMGFARAFAILDEAAIGRDDVLMWRGEVLTSEILRGEMNAELARHGAVAAGGGPIVACGAQAADPHERGEGPLYAHQFIIIDSFPMGPDFYYGDLTRTVLKGKASPWHQDLYKAVLDGQLLALEKIKAGADAKAIDAAIRALFDKRGFPTGVDAQGRQMGFFHGTGHSVGLEVHDKGPGISRGKAGDREAAPLPEGLMVTVEPGLYYPEKGGVRIEDIVYVTKDGCENITTVEKFLIIP